MKICVFGAASNEIEKTYILAVEEFGEKIANQGHALVFGAGGNGMMGAAARGVHKGGGKIYGVIPSFFRDEKIEAIFDKCDELIFTETMAQRKTKMEELADAFVIVPGGIGTFEEFFEVLTLKQLGRHTKPIVVYDVNGYYKKMEEFLDVSVKEKFICKNCKDLYYYSENQDDIMKYIDSYSCKKQDVHKLKLG
jgi:uncharacterized protein (TIGR00730 family)